MALWPLSELISSINGKRALRTELTGSNLEPAVDFSLSRDVVVAAGSSVTVYSNIDLSKYTHISGVFLMKGATWPHQIQIEWKNTRDSTVVRQDIVETGSAHKFFGTIPVITKNANISVISQDTVDRQIFTLDIYGHIRG